jgi:hypothetical protein
MSTIFFAKQEKHTTETQRTHGLQSPLLFRYVIFDF